MIRWSQALLLLLASGLSAQTTASATSYGSACPPWATLSTQGLPSLGSAFTASWSGHGFIFCTVGPIRAMVLGLGTANTQVTVPGVGGPCTMLVTPDASVPGLSVTVNIPNRTSLIGTDFYVQGAELGLNCFLTPNQPFDSFYLSDAVHCNVGL